MADVSVVTVNLNNAAGLRRTMASVQAQTCGVVEHVVIDGGSTDDSTAVISEGAGRLACWVSEPDRGIYHAMNKGIGMATRTYLLFLNSGDCFNGSDALTRLIAGGQGEDLVYGDLLLESDGVRRLRTYPDTLTFDHFRTTSLPHPCTLIRRRLLTSMQGYDESVSIVADWVFFMNAICLHGATYRHVAHPISVFTTDGLSSLPANQALVQRERLEALRRHYGAFLPDYEQHDARVGELRRFWCRAGRKIDRVARRALGPSRTTATGD